MDSWLIINIFGLIGTPAGLLDGWIAYRNLPERRSRRHTASLCALICATLNAMLLVATVMSAKLFTLDSTSGTGLLLIRCGVYLALAGVAFSLAEKPRLIVSGLFANVGMIALWFGLTVP